METRLYRHAARTQRIGIDTGLAMTLHRSICLSVSRFPFPVSRALIAARVRMAIALFRADFNRWNEARDRPLERWQQRLIPLALIAFILIAFGLVGRIDYETAVDQERETSNGPLLDVPSER